MVEQLLAVLAEERLPGVAPDEVDGPLARGRDIGLAWVCGQNGDTDLNHLGVEIRARRQIRRNGAKPSQPGPTRRAPLPPR
jgi:hypothetical protein